MMRLGLFLAGLLLIAGLTFADGPTDNMVDKVRPVPPPGIAISAESRAELEAGVAELGKEIENLRNSLVKKPALLELLPDVQIFYNSVHYALKYNEFYSPGEVAVAKKHLQQGRERAKSLRDGQAPWNTATGLIVRGYRSKIDGSVQPYGLVVPGSWTNSPGMPHRLDTWFHGRDEKLSEVNFIAQRERSAGEFTPANAFVLHLLDFYRVALLLLKTQTVFQHHIN